MLILKRLAARLPRRWHFELKRLYFARQILKGCFETDEQEFKLLDSLVQPGDWVVDIGANVGHYTKRLSELVGPIGRVIAYEPVPATFALLAANAQLFAHQNVTLINAAASDHGGIAGIELPEFAAGLSNYYQAHLSATSSEFNVMTQPVDCLAIDHRVSLVKIDVEGHEAAVLSGMRGLIRAYRPILILETNSEQLIAELRSIGYVEERLSGSSNVLLRPGGMASQNFIPGQPIGALGPTTT
jgi:FkbM family methyltransferase